MFQGGDTPDEIERSRLDPARNDAFVEESVVTSARPFRGDGNIDSNDVPGRLKIADHPEMALHGIGAADIQDLQTRFVIQSGEEYLYHPFGEIPPVLRGKSYRAVAPPVPFQGASYFTQDFCIAPFISYGSLYFPENHGLPS
jgi:hypothetical protein